MSIRELREQQARITTNARAKYDEITDDTPAERAGEIEREYDAMMADYDAIEARIARLERLEAAEERANAGDPRRPTGEPIEARGSRELVAPSYADAFVQAIRFGVGSLDADARAVLRSGRTDVPHELRAQSAVTGDAGGYTVPQEFSGELDRALAAWGPMWDATVVREITTANGRELSWPTVDDTGKTGRIKLENAAVDDDGTDDVAFGQKLLNAYIYDTGIVRVPIELLEDSFFDIEMLVNDLFAERLGRTANAVLTTGSGLSLPNGIVTAAGVGVTAVSGTAVTSDEIMDLLHSVDPAYRQSPKCRWQFNDTMLAAIRKLKDGQGNYLWQMGDVRTSEPSTLLGHPYSINQAMADAALSTRPIIFGDHSRYIVRKVSGFQMMTLRERYAENFQVGMVGFKRFDGELLNSAAVKAMVMAAA